MILTEEDVNTIIAGGESETVEFKVTFDNKAKESLGAFANTHGGYVIVGVDDRGNIRGVTATEQTLKNWSNEIGSVTEPTIIPYMSIVEVRSKLVVVIQVKEFPIKPVAVRGRCYRRVGASNRVLTPQIISDLHMESTGTTWDTFQAREKTVDDIDFARVVDYIRRARKSGRREYAGDEDPSRLLIKLDMMKEGIPTWAAVIAFGKNPLLQAKVRCGRIRGTSTIVDAYLAEDPLLDQVEEVMGFMRRMLQLSYKFTGEAKRTEVWDYPLDAIREAVTNAICHRDYRSPAETQIQIFDDKMSIWNPGGLPLGMTLEGLRDPSHHSIPRNQQVAALFYDVELIERYGSGIERMIDDCRRLGFPEPDFSEAEGGFEVVFRKDVYTEEYLKINGMNPTQIKAILYVKKHREISNKVLRDIANVSRATASRELATMVELGILEKHGMRGRGTTYSLRNAP